MEEKNGILVCGISDLHGHLPIITNECDILLIAGDIVPLDCQRSTPLSEDWFQNEFCEWCNTVPCKKILLIAGNHDFYLERRNKQTINEYLEKNTNGKATYLEDDLFDFDGLTIYGCPWCIGPFGWAFSPCDVHPSVLEKYSQIPDCDILLCHQPPKIDTLGTSYIGKPYARDFGSEELMTCIGYKNIGCVICGHIHSGNHQIVTSDNIDTYFYNVSIKDEDYKVSYMPRYFYATKKEK